ncbi:MAG: cobalt-precorrin-5B (C(1))-methyltransferase, partial [Bacteroidales bacterium]|nr:cobalt-precorrin-5B (C(1))-methyltransferase [Bacteroidales bacterium]
LYDGGLDVTISVPGGRELAQRTFNPKLGIVDGISIIGTSGIVRPFSNEAFVDAIRREIEVAVAVGTGRLVINSGAKSEAFLKKRYPDLPPQAFVHYGNFIGETLKIAAECGLSRVTMGIMLGKAVKLAEGHLDTHSKSVVMNKAFLQEVAAGAGCSPAAAAAIDRLTLARELWKGLPPDDLRRFLTAILTRCYAVCAAVYPSRSAAPVSVPLAEKCSLTENTPAATLTILLLDEDGNVFEAGSPD